jgi:class 3 adenylate cyclase
MDSPSFQYFDKRIDGGTHIALSKQQFDAFDASLLWVPKACTETVDGERFDALAAIFDLQGFTSFFDVRDPFATVPEFIEKFLQWLFETLRAEFSKKLVGDTVLLWSYLPMFAKFMGDGVLLLWSIPTDQRHGGAPAIGNIVARLHRTCVSYRDTFRPSISETFSDSPATLRCGGAFGQIAAVGDRHDYVGPCINVAARLQKLATLSFAFSRHGCDPDRCFKGEWRDVFTPAIVQIRGIHRAEPILIDVKEFESIPLKLRKDLFIEPKAKRAPLTKKPFTKRNN